MDKKSKTKGKNQGKGAGKLPVRKPAEPRYPIHWYYMDHEEITVEEIRQVLDPMEYNIEIWREAGVLEIGVSEKASVDMEECDLDMGDAYSNDFLTQNEVRSLFYVTINSGEEDSCVAAMKKIASVRGGMFCGDTEDFTPVIRP